MTDCEVINQGGLNAILQQTYSEILDGFFVVWVDYSIANCTIGQLTCLNTRLEKCPQMYTLSNTYRQRRGYQILIRR